MIRSDAEYRKAQRDLELALEMLEEERAHWEGEGMTEDEVHAMLEPMRLRVTELREEIEIYERIISGDLSMFTVLEDVGKALIGARLARGMSQREFAELLGVHESQVSRDERNEYHGVGSERLRELMQAVGLNFEGQFELADTSFRPQLTEVDRPAVYRQAAGLTLDPEEVKRDLENAVA